MYADQEQWLRAWYHNRSQRKSKAFKGNFAGKNASPGCVQTDVDRLTRTYIPLRLIKTAVTGRNRGTGLPTTDAALRGNQS